MTVVTPTPPDINDTDAKKISALKDRLGWLREWEQAQWQQRVRHQSAKPNLSIREAGTASGAKVDTAAGMPVEKTTDMAARAHQAVRSHAVHVPEAELVSTPVAGTVSRGAESPLQNGHHPATTALPQGPRTPLDALSAMRQRLLAGPTQWSPSFLHALQTANGVRVWLRDASLLVSHGSQILAAVRSQLRGLGLSLASLSINGETIWSLSEEHRAAAEADDAVDVLNRTY